MGLELLKLSIILAEYDTILFASGTACNSCSWSGTRKWSLKCLIAFLIEYESSSLVPNTRGTVEAPPLSWCHQLGLFLILDVSSLFWSQWRLCGVVDLPLFFMTSPFLCYLAIKISQISQALMLTDAKWKQ